MLKKIFQNSSKSIIKRFKYTKTTIKSQEQEEKELDSLYNKKIDKEIDWLDYVSKIHATRNG
jgi:hypothetical protein